MFFNYLIYRRYTFNNTKILLGNLTNLAYNKTPDIYDKIGLNQKNLD